jgi:hypothetical protein
MSVVQPPPTPLQNIPTAMKGAQLVARTVEVVKPVALDFTLKTNHFLLAAMTFAVALSWNDTLKTAAKEAYPGDRDNFKAKLLYSLIITFIVVILSGWMLPDTASVTPAIAGESGEHFYQLPTPTAKIIYN